jgi:hypothetical protein
MIFLWFATSVLGGTLYRMGGSEDYNTRWRDAGVSWLISLLMWHWSAVLHWGLCWGALTLSWKKKGTDAGFWNRYLQGFGVAVAALPYTICVGHWAGFIVRLAILPFIVALWATYMNRRVLCWREDVVSEFGRGFWIVASAYLL